MPVIIGVILSWIGSVATSQVITSAREIAIETAKWVATRGLLLFLMYIAFPIVMYNVLSHYGMDLYEYVINKVTDQTSTLNPITIEITGMGGWIGSQIGIVSMFSAYMSAISTRFLIDLIIRK